MSQKQKQKTLKNVTKKKKKKKKIIILTLQHLRCHNTEITHKLKCHLNYKTPQNLYVIKI